MLVDMGGALLSGPTAVSTTFPMDGPWNMCSGYMISNSDNNFLDNSTLAGYSAEKDFIVGQGFGTSFAIQIPRYKNLKVLNPNIRLMYYFSALPVNKVDEGGIGWGDNNYNMVEDSLRGNTQWYLKNTAGAKVQSKFDSGNYVMNMLPAYNSDNSYNRNYMEQFIYELYDKATTASEGDILLDYIDGFYFDVVPPRAQEVYLDGVTPKTETNMDFDQDTVADSYSDETAGGGVLMYRTGLAAWVDEFNSVFGSDYVLWRNGTRDGLDYSAGPLKASTVAQTASAFYQKWDGGMFEVADLGIEKTGNGAGAIYFVDYNGFEWCCRYIARMKANLVPEGSHKWGAAGHHAINFEQNVIDRGQDGLFDHADLLAVDHDWARFIQGFCALNGISNGLSYDKRYSFPRTDECKYEWGDTIDGNPPVMGVHDPSVPVNDLEADYTLRAPDYENGAADFYWQEFENVLWVVRKDYTGDNTYGYGSALDCLLPNPGTGKQWAHPDLSAGTYTNPNTGWVTRGQDNTLNSGSAVAAGGTYGKVTLLPAHAVMVIRENV